MGKIIRQKGHQQVLSGAEFPWTNELIASKEFPVAQATAVAVELVEKGDADPK